MNQLHSLIIIGSGPAGHTAAIYAARANLAPLMFEGRLAGGIAAGGQLTTTTEVENFPWFPHGIQWPELMNNMREQSLNSGATIITKTVDRVDLSSQPYKVFVGNDVYETKSIIIATGATAKKLDIPWVKDFWMRGISGCAVCDGALPIFRNKPLAVIGGGDVALEEATHLAKFGSKVYVLIRRGKGDLRASKAMQERAFANEKIEFLEYTEVLEAQGDKLLTGLTIINNQTGQKFSLEVSGLFFAIGHTPNTGFLEGQIVLDETGYIQTNQARAFNIQTIAGYTLEMSNPKNVDWMHYQTGTSVHWVFAAGDVQDKKYRQAITSAGTGCMAALEAEAWLNEQK